MAYDIDIRLYYPRERGRLTLRTESDWSRDVLPDAELDDGALFHLQTDRHALELKPVLHAGGEVRWCQSHNVVVYPPREQLRELYPHFYEPPFRGQLTEPLCVEGESGQYCLRAYLPPGYRENPYRTYPVLYMHDGRNLFDPRETPFGQEWEVDETMDALSSLSAIRRVIVIGVDARDREVDYGGRGYAAYTRTMVDTIVPAVLENFRAEAGPSRTAVMGSSLGGLVSFYMAWERPDVFGQCGCLSPSFWYENDLYDRVLCEPKRPIRVYLDSGSPRDNFDETRRMRDLLLLRGYELGRDLTYLVFPGEKHNEGAWARRICVPFQFMFGT